MTTAKEIRNKYLRVRPFPFCPGCGGGMVLNAFARAIDDMKIPNEDILIIAGIGCSSWIPSPFFKADTLHTTHGRSLSFGTGAKLANPLLKVVAFTGDGDGTGIGGNHLIHAARNNIDMVVLCINNNIYGMTGGQVAPTTPREVKTATTPYGNPSNPFDACKLVEGAGATFVARWTTAHIPQLISTIKKALRHKGFSFIEVVSQCPTHYGRRTGMQDAPSMLKFFKEIYSINAAESRMRLGEFVNIEKPELCEDISKMIEMVAGAEQAKEKKTGQSTAKGATCKPMQVRIAGRGGQGIVLAGILLGHAFASCGINVLQTQSYGAEARGGACKADVIASDEPINDLSPEKPDVLLAMSSEALEKYGNGVPLIILDDLVSAAAKARAVFDRSAQCCQTDSTRAEPLASGQLSVVSEQKARIAAGWEVSAGSKVVRVAATKTAKESGSIMSANMGMLGAFAAITGSVSKDALAAAIRENSDERFAEVNVRVMEKCFGDIGRLLPS